jgi:hypothetical protein
LILVQRQTVAYAQIEGRIAVEFLLFAASAYCEPVWFTRAVAVSPSTGLMSYSAPNTA